MLIGFLNSLYDEDRSSGDGDARSTDGMDLGDDGSMLPKDRTRIVGEFCSTRFDLGDEWNVRRELSKSARALKPFRVVYKRNYDLIKLDRFTWEMK